MMLEGYFGSLYKGVLVLRVPGHAWWYVLHVQDRELQWSMYCNDASIVPTHSGEVTNVECLGQRHRLSCWRVAPGNYVSESMRIADELEARCIMTPTVAIEPQARQGLSARIAG